MDNSDREAIWRTRVALWRDSGLSQRAFAASQDFPQRQLNYWARRLAARDATPALVPIHIKRTDVAAAPLALRSPSGWTVTLPPATPASWVAELLRALA
jgi:hypothetical protein